MLVPNHREHLIAEGFTEEQVDRLIGWGVRTIATPKEAHAMGLSRYVTGIWFPFRGEFGQLRVDQPKPESPKYLSPIGVKAQAWAPPGERAMVVTEGYKDGAIGTMQGGIPTAVIAGVSQKDLVPIFKTELVISVVLSGQRRFTVEHIEKLAAFFHVSPALFLTREF
jgi:hypothetical protein